MHYDADHVLAIEYRPPLTVGEGIWDRPTAAAYFWAAERNVINHLAYSPDRHWLAGSFGGENGTRLFEAASGHETGQDGDYGDTSQCPTAA